MDVVQRQTTWPETLPVQMTPFFDRVNEIAEIGRLLREPACRLITLIGPGGTGKTRLAMEAASVHQDLFPDGVYFAGLEPVRSPDFFIHSIASALDLPLSGPEDPAQQVFAILRDRSLLIIMDNFETMLDAAELLPDLLQATTRVKLLITSQVALNLMEEHLVPIAGVPYPDTELDFEEASQYASIQLFAACARRHRSNFDLDAEREGVARICRMVEGIPLAIELAASWTRLMSCAEIADEIQRNISFLTSNMRNLPARHRSIQAVFDHSWAMLSAPERLVFERLAVFQGGFDREAAAEVAGASLTQLSALADKSLLRREQAASAAEYPHDRYSLHSLLRQTASERLAESAEEYDQARDAHCRYYLRYMKRLVEQSHRGELLEALDLARTDYENIMAAWLRACEKHMAAELGSAALMIDYYCQMGSHYTEGMELFSRAWRALENEPPSFETHKALGLILNLFSWFCIRLGRYEIAAEAARKSLAHLNEIQADPEIGLATNSRLPLAVIAQIHGDYPEAERLAREVLESSSQRHDLINMALSYYVLASAHLAKGMFEEARQFAQSAYQSAKLGKNTWFMAYCLVEWGSAAYGLGDYREAGALYESAYAIRETFNDPEGMAIALTHLGQISLANQHYDEAARLYQQARDIYERIYDRGGLAAAVDGLCQAAIAAGSMRQARRLAVEALTTIMGIDFNSRALDVLTTTASLFLAGGSFQRGCQLLTYVIHHPAAEHNTRQRARRLLDEAHPGSAGFRADLGDTGSFDEQPISQVIQAALQDLTDQLITNLPALAADPVRNNDQARSNGSPPGGGQRGQSAGLVEPLSVREIEILDAMAKGLSNQAIASSLILSTGTVKWYTSQIYGKLGVNSRTQAIARARELGIIF